MDLKFQHQSFHFSFIALLTALLIALSCGGLAIWQYQRAFEKQQQLNYIADKASLGLLPWQDLTSLPKHWNKTGLMVNLSGEFVTDKYWLLDNRVLNGRVGYDVIALLKLPSELKGILVNLGWIAAEQSREVLPTVDLPNHPITFTAQIKQGDLAGFYLEHTLEQSTHWPKRIQFIDLDMLELQSKESLVEYMAYSTQSISDLTPHYEPVVMGPEKHKAYALQWGLIGVAAIAVFIFASRTRERHE